MIDEDFVTAEKNREEHFQNFLTSYDGDWGYIANRLADERKIPRTEAWAVILAMQINTLSYAIEGAYHPKFNPKCPHCVEVKRVADIQTAYMERVMKHLEDEENGEGWKPL